MWFSVSNGIIFLCTVGGSGFIQIRFFCLGKTFVFADGRFLNLFHKLDVLRLLF